MKYIKIFCALALLAGFGTLSSYASTKNTEAELREKIRRLEKQNAKLKKQVQALSGEKESGIVQVKEGTGGVNQTPEDKSITAVEKKKIWKYNVGLGYTYRSGNDESQEGNLVSEVVRETERDKLFLGATGLLGTDTQGQQVSKASGRTQYNHDINQTFYWLVLGNAEYDSPQRLDYRAFAGPGLGWRAIRTENMDLNLEGGPALEFEKFSSQPESSSFKGRLAQNFEYRFTEKARVFQGVEVLGDPTNDNQYLFSARGGIETGLTKFMSIRLTLQDQYNASPLPGTKNNDFSAITSLIFTY